MAHVVTVTNQGDLWSIHAKRDNLLLFQHFYAITNYCDDLHKGKAALFTVKIHSTFCLRFMNDF